MPHNINTSSNQQYPNNHSPHRKIARFLLCLLLFALFLLFFKNADILQMFGIFATILSINLFEPIFSVIDRLDPLIWRLITQIELYLRALFTFHLPGAGRRIKGNSHVIVSSLSILILLYLLFHSLVGDSIVVLKDETCLGTGLPIPSSFCNSGIGITTLPDNIRVGLITSSAQGPFDTSSLNGQEQQVEQQIFQEDQLACNGPHITLVDVTILSRTIADPSDSASKGLDDLHGVYLAQHDYNAARANYNSAQHNGLPFISVCLAIANLGTQVTADQKSAGNLYTLPTVIKQLVQFSRYDNTFRGIVGFPYSTQALEGIQALRDWGRQNIPIVSPSATSDELSNVTNFYRVSPPDDSQGQAMAYYVCNVLKKNNPQATIDIFSNSDAYSSSLSNKFSAAISTCFDPYHMHFETYQNGNAASIQAATEHAIAQKYTFIFFPGYEADLDTLQEQIQNSTQGAKSSITILGGDGLEDIENPNHDTFVPVYSTVYASPLNGNDPASMQLVQEYQAHHFLMPYLAHAVPGYTLLPQGVIRSYNAMKMFTSTLVDLTQQDRSPTQDILNEDLATISFNGIGGHFSFQGDAINSDFISDPQGSILPIYIICTTRDHLIHLASTYYGNHLLPAQETCS